MKLSEQIKQCLEDRKCTNCDCYDAETVLTCKGLLQAAYERIKEYESLEEQEKLLKLPCAVGDTVYIINPKNMRIEDNHTVEGFRIYENEIMIETKICNGVGGFLTDALQFEKYAFLNEDEAKEKLKELLQ